MILTIGYTQSDLPDYSSFADGYRAGAAQVTVDLRLDGDGSEHSGEDWAAAVYRACQFGLPDPRPGSLAHAVYRAFHQVVDARGLRLRSFSVGDTVTIRDTSRHETWACARVGFDKVEPPLHPDNGDDLPRDEAGAARGDGTGGDGGTRLPLRR